MVNESKPGMRCTEFDALLSDAIDGTLGAPKRELFEQHRRECESCRTLHAEVARGIDWLEELQEAEPPRNLVHNILAATSRAPEATVASEPHRSALERLMRQLRVVLVPVLTPRFAMTMGMAFFSITLVLNMAQISVRDLTPRNLNHTFYSSENKVMKYYENMRLVYEIESRVRDLRNANDESEREMRQRRQSTPQQQNKNSQPGGHENRGGSVAPGAPTLAALDAAERYYVYEAMVTLRRQI